MVQSAPETRAHVLVHEAGEHRVVVTSSDVKAATGGKYYLRTYDNAGGAYAKASDGEGLYCGVTDGFITPSLREANIESEYVSDSVHQLPLPDAAGDDAAETARAAVPPTPLGQSAAREKSAEVIALFKSNANTN